jgi:hypothetical protein
MSRAESRGLARVFREGELSRLEQGSRIVWIDERG